MPSAVRGKRSLCHQRAMRREAHVIREWMGREICQKRVHWQRSLYLRGCIGREVYAIRRCMGREAYATRASWGEKHMPSEDSLSGSMIYLTITPKRYKHPKTMNKPTKFQKSN